MTIPATLAFEAFLAIVASVDDEAHHTKITIDRDGRFRVFVPGDGRHASQQPWCAVESHLFAAGNGYVGAGAAADDEWMQRLHRSMLRGWENFVASGRIHCAWAVL